jgi:ribonuclease D
VAQLARDERLDPALLATRADIVAFLREDQDARLGTGWRNELVGEGIRRLVGGEAGLTFDPHGRLRLTTVSD